MKIILLTALAAALAHSAVAAEITVSAAASLTDAFNDIAKAYQTQYPDAKINLNYAGSGALLQQIAKGAPVDVFASADGVTMDKAAEYIDPATRHNFVENSLVVIVPHASSWDGKDLAALMDDKNIKRIAIAHVENVPVGRYTKSALDKAGLWDKLGERNLPTQNVRQSLDYVARGEADAGFVYATDAALMPDKVKVVLHVPLEAPPVYPIAVLKKSKAAEEGKRFIDYIRSEDGQKILHGYGFATAKE
ncbi:molybdate ABC transporter substrate-binding protein [Cardiobacterium hominis]|uniref:molybdate ABC transporter substrate-binding protein n=1 Tax=Cardiobacterium hominis TaxID=2718 RepID=UPI0028D7D5EF|nr:molybdate ABC transporter substrate-binding protein [Cardiobacterium hominis]